jgi:hypothetical protein
MPLAVAVSCAVEPMILILKAVCFSSNA